MKAHDDHLRARAAPARSYEHPSCGWPTPADGAVLSFEEERPHTCRQQASPGILGAPADRSEGAAQRDPAPTRKEQLHDQQEDWNVMSAAHVSA